MKKITLFFAIALMSIGAAYSQAPATVTYEQFISEVGKHDGKTLSISNAVLDASPAGTKGINCSSINPDQVVVALSSDKTKSPATICIKGDKKIIMSGTRNGATKMSAVVTLSGNQKDGYTISSVKFIRPTK